MSLSFWHISWFESSEATRELRELQRQGNHHESDLDEGKFKSENTIKIFEFEYEPLNEYVEMYLSAVRNATDGFVDYVKHLNFKLRPF